jgi:hypothetical protein
VFNAAQCDGLPEGFAADPAPLPEREIVPVAKSGQFSFTNCAAIGFPRHGFNSSADLSGQGGNTNASFMSECTAVRNYVNGFHFQGADNNALTIIHPNALYNGQCGINIAQFLANTILGRHTEGNGTNDSGPRTMPQQLGAQCYYNGRYWNVYPGRAAAASTSVPGADPLIWVDRGPGTLFPTYPTWASGMPWTEGSCLRATSSNAQNGIFGGYDEPGQPAAFIGGGGMQLAGQTDAGLIGSAYMYVSNGMLTTRAFQVIDGVRTVVLGAGRYAQFKSTGFFPWNLTHDGTGGFVMNYADVNTVYTVTPPDAGTALAGTMRIAKPLLGSMRIESAIAPVATAAVVKVIPAFDAAGTEIGVIEVKARA